LSAIAQLELKTIRERTAEGIAIAKAEGKFKGRKKGAIKLKGEPLKRFVYFCKLGMSVTKLAQEFSVPRCTIYRWKKALQEKIKYRLSKINLWRVRFMNRLRLAEVFRMNFTKQLQKF